MNSKLIPINFDTFKIETFNWIASYIKQLQGD